MRMPVLFAALLLTTASPTAAFAQTPAPPSGVAIDETKDWLVGLGGRVTGPETVSGLTTLRVSDGLPWTLRFFACTQLCDDAQFSAHFNGSITEAQVSAWNRDNRFAKAIWIAPTSPDGQASVLLQYDLLLTQTGVDQLREPTVIWLKQLRVFVRQMFGELRTGLVLNLGGEVSQPSDVSPQP